MSQLFHSKLYLNVWRCNQAPARNLRLKKRITLLSLTLLSLAACTQSASTSIQLSLEVKSTPRLGTYDVSGTTNLPDQSRISVVGIRYFKSPTASSVASTSSNYSILARQSVEVSQNRWQSTLNLWKSVGNGRYQEAWQTKQNRQLTGATASEDVLFVATFEPENQTALVQKQIRDTNLSLDKSTIRLTDAGQPYLQVQQITPLRLPPGEPSIAKTINQDDGWGDRASLKTQPTKPPSTTPLPTERQTTAPLSNTEQFR
jgi:hypothetical protein